MLREMIGKISPIGKIWPNVTLDGSGGGGGVGRDGGLSLSFSHGIPETGGGTA
jgi:hypothetical protein